MIYISLFLSAFFAATIFPAQSELVLLYLLQDRSNSVVLLLLAATVGNVLGAVVNYGLGYYVPFQRSPLVSRVPAAVGKSPTRLCAMGPL